jgi:hypothetical protein
LAKVSAIVRGRYASSGTCHAIGSGDPSIGVPSPRDSAATGARIAPASHGSGLVA